MLCSTKVTQRGDGCFEGENSHRVIRQLLLLGQLWCTWRISHDHENEMNILATGGVTSAAGGRWEE